MSCVHPEVRGCSVRILYFTLNYVCTCIRISISCVPLHYMLVGAILDREPLQIFVQFCVFGTREDWKKGLCDCGCSTGGESDGENQPLLADNKRKQMTVDVLQRVPPPNSD